MKKTLYVFLALILAGFVAYFYFDEPLPNGKPGIEAEALTDKMFRAIGKEAWDSIAFVSFSFRNKHHYVWDKLNNSAEISWDDFAVQMNLDTQTGSATKGNEKLEDDAKEKALEKAWKHWCNDSFWLIAPAKARDGGTSRYIVKLDDGLDGLLVRYNSGGVTPGDVYLWALNEDGLPEYFKMWVSIIPIGGMQASWSDWEDFNGAKIATSHTLGSFTLQIDSLKVGESLEDIQ